jgi:hypothetical protein
MVTVTSEEGARSLVMPGLCDLTTGCLVYVKVFEKRIHDFFVIILFQN